jgi:hypothetical protein
MGDRTSRPEAATPEEMVAEKPLRNAVRGGEGAVLIG